LEKGKDDRRAVVHPVNASSAMAVCVDMKTSSGVYASPNGIKRF
jgi:hypothetical protein